METNIECISFPKLIRKEIHVRSKRKISSKYNLSLFSKQEIFLFERSIFEEFLIFSFNKKEFKINMKDVEGDKNPFGISIYTVMVEKIPELYKEYPFTSFTFGM